MASVWNTQALVYTRSNQDMNEQLDEFHLAPISFNSYYLSFIPHILNICAGRLSKEARAQGSIFSHVKCVVPSWMASEVNQLEPV